MNGSEIGRGQLRKLSARTGSESETRERHKSGHSKLQPLGAVAPCGVWPRADFWRSPVSAEGPARALHFRTTPDF
eukprot:9066286-Alexandrium_andersonii.AAC.1